MQKIKTLSVKRYRLLNVKFENGQEGTFHLKDKFKGVAAPLLDPEIFSTARIINNGSGVGFDGCEYDICGQLIYQNLKPLRGANRSRRVAHHSH